MDTLLQDIKKDFYRYRNGIVAESLRKLYDPDVLIFGLTVPQLMEIARKYPKDLKLGLQLWKDKKTRESRLLALYLIPVALLEKETAREMFLDIRNFEEADFLTFRILRNTSYSEELYNDLCKENLFDPKLKYGLTMFKKNLDMVKPV